VLVRSDSAGASTRLAWHLRDRGVGFSLGMPIDAPVGEAILAQPEQAWTPAVDADGQVRDGAEVCELTGWVDLGTWPAGTRLLCRREDAHPGAQLRFSDHDGHRFQVFLTDQPDGDLACLELRHRQRARVEDRIRAAKATGLSNLPFDMFRRNQVWLELVLAAQDLVCFTQALLLEGRSPWPNPRRCATGCSIPPPGWSAMPAASSCGCKPPGHGRPRSPARSPGYGRSRCAADATTTRWLPARLRARPGCPLHAPPRKDLPPARHSQTIHVPGTPPGRCGGSP
jgi:hypothetical protein